MKFLAALVLATATSVVANVVLNNPAPVLEGVSIYSNEKWAVGFRTPALEDDVILPGITRKRSPSLAYFKFAVSMNEYYPANASMFLQLELCPSVNDIFTRIFLLDLPDCTEPTASSRIHIDSNGGGVDFRWFPDPYIVVAPNATYWFALGSSIETSDKQPTWLYGKNDFSTANNSTGDVKVAHLKGDGDSWTLLPQYENRVPSLLVISTYTN
ncbi:hypothetical protein AaE_015156 [Aphanomyces astaci]|uniref:Uncharacterized protein n=1 Tax=Aphanomyces astaci TaxID=112090 RepID=A0A6A4YYL6_APHAT|nr:hypothetical protein AaE_015156 [Aphanomyces astaci]